MNIKKSLLALSLGTVSALSYAATSTANFQVSATVNPTCTISASNIAFGAFTPSAAGTNVTTGTLDVLCTNNTPWNIKLSEGTTAGATFAQRLMAGATNGNTDTLKYNLSTTNNYSGLWGDGSPGTTAVNGTGAGTNRAVTVYALMPLNQYAQPDNYTDNITVTLTY